GSAGDADAGSFDPPDASEADGGSTIIPAQPQPPQKSPPPPPPSPRLETKLAGASAAAPADGSDFLADLVALERKIEDGVHAFSLLSVPLAAGKREIRGAWGELSRKFHPDALKGPHRELRERVSAVFAALSEAHQVLGDADQRAKLKESIEKGEHESKKDGRDATATARAVFQSELLAKEADKLLRANRFDRALAQYREAATYNPDEPDLRAAIIWCEYQVSDKGGDAMAQARAALDAIIEEAPKLARAHYFLGFVLVDQGSPHIAIETFRRAARLDARLIDAERQARALEMRVGRTPLSSTAPNKGKIGGIKGLFGKK
ncbi:MAG: tetratricopeptide repeat protein, partial [Myxococcales bacterium]|nr:tetratricopeptide repeat protein [Myxococcales bacterium]